MSRVELNALLDLHGVTKRYRRSTSQLNEDRLISRAINNSLSALRRDVTILKTLICMVETEQLEISNMFMI